MVTATTAGIVTLIGAGVILGGWQSTDMMAQAGITTLIANTMIHVLCLLHLLILLETRESAKLDPAMVRLVTARTL